ncbi:MAG: NADH-quinone oxidoreductase subunit J [Anaerolineales bacterium]|nr:NADH-quinone oxidoreductase subunit J [Anaerolineales bacterium]
MTVEQGIFLFIGFVILFSAFMMVTRSNLIHAALYLVLVLFGVAVLFVLLDAGFLAVVQIIVYIGAIAILMIFAVMLTRGNVTGEAISMNSVFGWGLLLCSLFGFALIIMLGQWPGAAALAPALPANWNEVSELGVALVSPQGYVIPFEVASVLLLAALIGAIVVARPPQKDE